MPSTIFHGVFILISFFDCFSFFIEENKKHYRMYTNTLVWCQFSESEIKLFQSSSRRSYCKKQRSYRRAHKRIINYNAKHQNKVYSHFVHDIFFVSHICVIFNRIQSTMPIFMQIFICDANKKASQILFFSRDSFTYNFLGR